MVMKIEPFHEALCALKIYNKKGAKTAAGKKTHVILTSAKGKLFTQPDALRLASYDRLVFLCGRYEGVDERVAEHLVDEELSIGPYVLTGGELPALVMLDAIARQRPGVLGAQASLAEESWKSYQKGVAAWVEKASQSAPAGSDVAVNALKSTFAASTAAFDQFQKATKQVVDLADASVRAAAANATKAAAASKVKRAA